jgi:hypothetical protein
MLLPENPTVIGALNDKAKLSPFINLRPGETVMPGKKMRSLPGLFSAKNKEPPPADKKSNFEQFRSSKKRKWRLQRIGLG